jgi:hypothetical protein
VTDGKLNNWWPYLFDFNRFNGDRITYPVEGFPERPATYPPINGEYGTELGTAELWGFWHSFSDFGSYGEISIVRQTENSAGVKTGQFALQVAIDEDWYQGHGRNDAIFPISRNARWNLANLRELSVSLKPGVNASRILGANPVIRLCANGGNRIELAPLRNGVYANLILENRFKNAAGWSVFDIPIAGNTNWEVNVFGYIDPSLSAAEIAAAKQQLRQQILAEVNYVEISIRSDGTRGLSFSYYIDDLEFRFNP